MASGCRGRAAPGICREQQQWWGEILPRKPRATAPACAASPGTVRAEGQHRGTPMSQEWLQGFPYCPSSSWLAWKPLAFLSSTLIPDFHPLESLQGGCSWVKHKLQVCCSRNDFHVSAGYFWLLQFLWMLPQQTDTDRISPCVKMLIKRKKNNKTQM